MAEKPKVDRDRGFHYSTKRCPECYAYMPLHASRCPSCHIRVGEVELHGMAKRTTNWGSYVVALLAILAFAVYFWWAFMG
jgi:hypothetical protein